MDSLLEDGKHGQDNRSSYRHGGAGNWSGCAGVRSGSWGALGGHSGGEHREEEEDGGERHEHEFWWCHGKVKREKNERLGWRC